MNLRRSLVLWLAFSPVACAARAEILSPPIATSAAPTSIETEEPVSSLPSATTPAEPCAIDRLRDHYMLGHWKEGERLAQRCLEKNPLSTEARIVLVRMYLMRAYAAHEPRWLDEAKRQLKMVAADPAFAKETRELSLLVEQPIIE